MSMFKQLFYKTTKDFSEQYDVSEEMLIELLLDCTWPDSTPRATLLGMSEIDMLKKLDMWITVEGYDETEDPRNLIYIIYNNI
jgi:hypothetical protein